jgi:hypothetical protein
LFSYAVEVEGGREGEHEDGREDEIEGKREDEDREGEKMKSKADVKTKIGDKGRERYRDTD